jgi:hypothetical protein
MRSAGASISIDWLSVVNHQRWFFGGTAAPFVGVRR